MASFEEALDGIDPDGCDRVRAQLLGWTQGADPQWQRVARNIEEETALVLPEFRRLVRCFADKLHRGHEPNAAWISACRESKLVGVPLATDRWPDVIGRAMTLASYASILLEDAAINRRRAQSLIRRAVREGIALTPALKRTLERTRVGRFLVWATFDGARPNQHPFEGFDHTTANIRAAFGLGHCGPTEPMVLIAYRARGRDLDLRRPTVADAEDNQWYRPHSDPAHPHGWIEPLPPNAEGLPPQPEVVHAETVAEDLIVPLYGTK